MVMDLIFFGMDLKEFIFGIGFERADWVSTGYRIWF